MPFRIYASMDPRMPPREIAAHARRAESLGYDALNVPEAIHDGLLCCQLALAATSRLRVATSVLVAFPRSPMAVAIAAWDLQSLSGGRFELGIGSQVRGNVEGRYSTAWTPPVPRMREYVGALRAIFASWQDRAPLAFEGEEYRFTRMQPFFDPGPVEGGPPPIHLGGVGPRMTELAGEAADGLLTHPTASEPRYLREVTQARLEAGAARVGRAQPPPLMASPLLALGDSEAEIAAQREKQRRLLAFLYSTPAYWPPLALFGWQERGERLRALTREDDWSRLEEVVDDEMLDRFVPAASWTEIAPLLRERYRGICDWIALPLPEDPRQDGRCRRAIEELRA